MNPTRRILRAAGTVGMATVLSRILGFVRDMVMAWGFSPMARDAFFVAFRLPNTLRRLFAEGALVVSFVPVFTDIVERDKKESLEVYRVSATLLSIVLAVVCILGMVFSRQLIMLFAPGFFDDPGKAQLTIVLNRIMFPFLFFVSLVALAQGVLNTLDHYFAPATAQSLHNLTMIIGVLWFSRLFNEPIIGLAYSVILGGVAMLALQWPYLRQKGYTFKFRFNFRNPAVKRVLYLMGPAAFGLLVYQFNMLASTIFASLLPTGSVSWLYYAQRFTELPLGIFAVAIGTAILPTLSSHLSSGDVEGYRKSYVYGLNLVLFLMIPAMFGLIYLSLPIFSAFFQRREFSYQESLMSAQALIAYAIGIPAIAGTRVTAPAFYARKDTRTPVRIAVWAFIINLVLSVVFMGTRHISEPLFHYFGWRPSPGPLMTILTYNGYAHVGLAMATTVSSWYNFIALQINLQRTVGSIDYWRVIKSMLRTMVAGAVMLIPVKLVAFSGLADWTRMGMKMDKIVVLLVASLLGIAVFIAAAYAMRQEELMEFVGVVKRRLNRGAAKAETKPSSGDKPPGGDYRPPPPTE